MKLREYGIWFHLALFYLFCISASVFIQSAEARISKQTLKASQNHNIPRAFTKLKHLKHFDDIGILPDSFNTQPYVSSPFSLPPFESLGPISLPQNAPPFCGNPPSAPQSPSTTVPTPGIYPSPPSPFYGYNPGPNVPTLSPPLSPIGFGPNPPTGSPSPSPSPPWYGPSPPETIPGTPSFVPGTPEISPGTPEISPGTPLYVPNPPEVGSSPPTVFPSPPSNIPGSPQYGSSPPGMVPTPPSIIPGAPQYGSNPPGSVPGSPSYGTNPPGSVPSPPEFGSGPPGYVPNPPIYFPSPPGFLPNPPVVFLPPVVYPPPLAPPPPQRGPRFALWCVAKPSVPYPIIQEAMDYACWSGADCGSIQPNGSCYKPDTLIAHASYAFNSYWQRTKAAGGTCDFGGTAMLVTVDPSFDGCIFLHY